jgi:probable O-glycosylation ligase (exosortase A-associated)
MTVPMGREWWRPETSASRPETAALAEVGIIATGSPVPFWALIAFTVALLLAPQHSYPILAAVRIALLTAVIAIATHVYDRLRCGRPLTILTPEIRITGYLLGWALVTLPFSYWPGGSVAVLFDLYLKTLTIFLLIANTVNSVARLRIIALALTVMAVPICLSGINAYLAGALSEDSTRSAARIVGHEGALTKNPNDLALILNLILPLTLALVFITRRAAFRLVLLGAVGLEAVAVIITFSRAGFLSLASILAAYFWVIRRRPERGWAYGGLILLVACLPFLPGEYLTRLSTITNIEADATGSAQHRYAQQIAAVNYVLKHPIVGAGIGMNVLAMHEELGDWLFIHNVFLQYAADLGLPGLILFVMLLAASIRSARSVQRRTAEVPEHRDLFFLATGIQMSLLAFTVSAFFSPVAYYFQFYYFAGLAVAVHAVHESLARMPEPASGEPPCRP